MKIGVISHGSPDYLVDIVTDGLIRLLGRQGISLDYNTRCNWGGSYAHLLQGFAGPEPYDIHEADALVVSLRSLHAMKAWIERTGKRNIVVLDGEDVDALHDVHRSVKVYFKREYLRHRTYPVNVKPLPFAAIPEEMPPVTARTNNVFWKANETHPFRKKVREAISAMGLSGGGISSKKAEYNELLASSKVGICARGAGWDTYRYWETPYFGAAMLSQRMEIVIPENFIDNQEAMFFDGIPDFFLKLKCLLRDSELTQMIARAGQKACMERHLSIHRAKKVLEALS